jgi:hypothetical protein
VLHAVGRALDVVFGPPFRWLEHHLFDRIGAGFTRAFGSWTPVVGIGIGVGIGVLLAVVLVRRRSRVGARTEEMRTVLVPLDPAALEDEADRLASVGDYAAAVRLRFQAGLLRLEAAGLVADQGVRTDTQMSVSLGSPTFDRLARRHEAVTYAGDPSSADDVEDARSSWPQVPDEARSRQALSGAGRR